MSRRHPFSWSELVLGVLLLGGSLGIFWAALVIAGPQ
jgi:hypothetical protein